VHFVQNHREVSGSKPFSEPIQAPPTVQAKQVTCASPISVLQSRHATKSTLKQQLRSTEQTVTLCSSNIYTLEINTPHAIVDSVFDVQLSQLVD